MEVSALDRSCRRSSKNCHWQDPAVQAARSFLIKLIEHSHTILWPSHAYVPGSNERHAADAFEAIRATATDDLTPGQLARSAAFQHGLLYLDNGYYWEAHEVLEAVWLALPPNGDEKRFVQGLIQLANACLKQKMERPNAVRRLCEMSRELFRTLAPDRLMGQEVSVYLKRVDSLEAQI